MGRHHNRSNWVRIVAGGVAAVALFVGGHEFATWEGHTDPVTETKTVTEYRVPQACLDVLDAAAEGLDLAGDYDEEMRGLHAKDGGVHIFTPGDKGGHYETAQDHHKDLTAARRAFDEAASQCRGAR